MAKFVTITIGVRGGGEGPPVELEILISRASFT